MHSRSLSNDARRPRDHQHRWQARVSIVQAAVVRHCIRPGLLRQRLLDAIALDLLDEALDLLDEVVGAFPRAALCVHVSVDHPRQAREVVFDGVTRPTTQHLQCRYAQPSTKPLSRSRSAERVTPQLGGSVCDDCGGGSSVSSMSTLPCSNANILATAVAVILAPSLVAKNWVSSWGHGPAVSNSQIAMELGTVVDGIYLQIYLTSRGE